MTVYSYAELEGLWINAGGSRALAPLMAAIAEAESGGNSQAQNPSGATGLWQILGNPFPGNAFDPQTNARMAVAKYKSQGLGAWETYTNGAYKAFLSNKTAPNLGAGGGPQGAAGPGAGTGPQLTAAQAEAGNDCIFGFGWNLFGGPVGTGAGIAAGLIPGFGGLGALTGGGQLCLITRSELRGMAGVALMGAGGLVGLAAAAMAAVAVGMRAAGPLGGAAEGVGGALMLVPGAQGLGTTISTAGRTVRNPAREGRRRAAAGAREDAALEKRLGQPKENPDLEVRGGAVRQSTQQRTAQRARQRAAARPKAPGNGNGGETARQRAQRLAGGPPGGRKPAEGSSVIPF